MKRSVAILDWIKPTAASFDHLVGDGHDTGRYGQTQCLGSFEIDNQLKLCRTDNRQITGLFAFQNSANEDAGLAIPLCKAYAVAHQPAVGGCGASTKHGGNRVMRR